MTQSKTGAKEFVAEVKEFLNESNWSMTAMSKAAGISSSALSQVLSEKYAGDTASIQAKLASVIAREKDKAATVKSAKVFIKTPGAARVLDIARNCHVGGEIGVCYSNAGLGKTEAVREYARRNSDVILIEADPGYTALVLFQELLSATGGTSRIRLHDLFSACCQRLNDSGRLLIVDEAEQLPYKALEMLRRLHDKAGIGILLTGMPKLLFNLRGNKGEYAQLYSRVSLSVKLPALTEKDTADILERLLPECPDKAKKTFFKESDGNFRRLVKIITHAKRVAKLNNREIDDEVVQYTAKFVKMEVMS